MTTKITMPKGIQVHPCISSAIQRGARLNARKSAMADCKPVAKPQSPAFQGIRYDTGATSNSQERWRRQISPSIVGSERSNEPVDRLLRKFLARFPVAKVGDMPAQDHAPSTAVPGIEEIAVQVHGHER